VTIHSDESATTIGLVGCGLWGRNILRDLLRLRCRVLVVDPEQDSRDRALAAGATEATETLEQMPRVDGVIVATPASTHAAVVEPALGLDVPVFVEKPFTTDVVSAMRLARAAPDRLFVMHVWRYHPGVQMLAGIARSEELGPVHQLRTTRTNWTSPRKDIDPIWTLAPHDLSIMLEVLGEIPQPRFAVAERVGRSPVGLVGVLGDDPTVVLEVSTRYREKRREVRLHCRDGVAVLPHGESAFVEITRDPELGAEHRPFEPEAPLYLEVKTFVDFLHGGPAPRSSVGQALEIVKALAALRTLAGI